MEASMVAYVAVGSLERFNQGRKHSKLLLSTFAGRQPSLGFSVVYFDLILDHGVARRSRSLFKRGSWSEWNGLRLPAPSTALLEPVFVVVAVFIFSAVVTRSRFRQ
jgi:hypothetical protein